MIFMHLGWARVKIKDISHCFKLMPEPSWVEGVRVQAYTFAPAFGEKKTVPFGWPGLPIIVSDCPRQSQLAVIINFTHICIALWENQRFTYAKTKTQITAFVFATQTAQSLYFLNPKFQASSHLQKLYSLVCFRIHNIGFPTLRLICVTWWHIART